MYSVPVRILTVCGSLQKNSANLELLRSAANAAPSHIHVVHFDGIRWLPHFDPDLEQTTVSAAVNEWRAALRECQGVLIASPEYGHSLPGSLKNAIDWVIGSGELYQKTVALTAAVSSSERGRMGLQALRQTFLAVDAKIVGGEPIVRGPLFHESVYALLVELIKQST